MKKVLFISNTANFSKFNRPFMKWFKEQGWQVDYCSAGEENVLDCDNQYSISIARSPFSLKNIKALKELKEILNKNQYTIIHCHTPMGGVLGRLAAKRLWKAGKIKVIYTAHGFHFYKGAPLLNWILYYPMEKWLSRYEDALVTINDEDFDRVKTWGNIYKINGVGVNLSKFHLCTKLEKSNFRKELGFSDNDFIITVVAECNKNKNQIMLIRNIAKLKTSIPTLKVLLIGKETLSIARNCVEKVNLFDTVQFLGYRNDVDKLTMISDIAFSASLREGLPVNIIEAMACGIPVVCSDNRGHRSLIKNNETGYIFSPKSDKEMVEAIIKLSENQAIREKMGENNIKESKKYAIDIAISDMSNIYNKFMD
jgi:glycosyltransferase EpsD